MAAGTVIAITLGIQMQLDQEAPELHKEISFFDQAKTLAVPITMIIGMNSCVFVFIFVLKRNKNELDTEECKAKYGQLYQTIAVKYEEKERSILNLTAESSKSLPKWSTLLYPIVFLVRRAIFVAITFLLFKHPGIQIQLFIYCSLMYIIFI